MRRKPDVELVLADHEKRLSKLEARFTKKKASPNKTKKATTLSDHILELRDSGFFATPRTAEDVHKKLGGRYHCEPNRVAVALFRMSSRRLLRKARTTKNSKNYQAYVW